MVSVAQPYDWVGSLVGPAGPGRNVTNQEMLA